MIARFGGAARQAWPVISGGSGMNSRTSCAQRQEAAILAAQRWASSRSGTSTMVKPPMKSRYAGLGPWVILPSVATLVVSAADRRRR
jgi:hypothetical protein